MRKYSFMALIVALFIVIAPNVSAANYYSTTLTLPDNSHVVGAFRNYQTGNHVVDMTIDSYYTTCSAKDNQTRIQLINDTRTLNDITVSTKVGMCLYRILGNYYSGRKKYVFSSDVFYVPYCGIVSNDVKLYPKA